MLKEGGRRKKKEKGKGRKGKKEEIKAEGNIERKLRERRREEE